MKREIYTAFVAIAVSCHSVVTFAKSEVQEEIKHTSALTSDGRVHIDNVNGKVHVTGWDRSEVKIVATKRADKQSDMDAVKVQIEASPDQVQIHTRYPKNNGLWKRSNSTKVDYEVKVPFGAKLDRIENVNGSVELEGIQGDVRASTVNGSLIAKGLAGDAKLESVNGAVDASFDKFDGVKAVSLNAVNGKISLTLPQNANANVTAETVNGSIQTGPELPVKKNWPVGSELNGKLGKGGATVRAETVNGGIRIAQAAKSAQSNDEGKVRLED